MDDEREVAETYITPEMVRAGVRVACLYDMRQDDWAEVVREVYAEMRLLEPRLVAGRDVAVTKSRDRSFSPLCNHWLNYARFNNKGLPVSLRGMVVEGKPPSRRK